MASHYVANTLSTLTTPYFYFWTTFSKTQPMTVFQTVWPSFPLTLPYEVTVPSLGHRPSYMASDYAGVVVPSRVIPSFYNTVIEKPSPKNSRKFFLDRSVYDLVDAHPYLSLTDPTLLGWYLSLSPEDRKIIQDDGGFHQFLKRHPALEMSTHHVYVKCNIGSTSPAQPTMTSNKQISRASGAKCRCEMPQTHPLEMLPNNVRETLTLLGCSSSWDGSQKHPHEEQLVPLPDGVQPAFNSPIIQEPNHQKAQKEGSHLSQLNNERRPSWQMVSSSSSAAVCKGPAALASFSVDKELERCRQGGKPELRSQIVMTQGQSVNFTYAEVSPFPSEWPTVENESTSEYYSFAGIQMDGSEYNDRSVIQSVEPEQASSLLDPVEGNRTKEGYQDHMVYGNEYTVDDDDDEASLSFEDRSDNFHSIREDDNSILVCLASEDVKPHANRVHSYPVTTNNKALAASRETLTSDQSVIKTNTAEKYTSPMPGVTTCDIMVGTELALCMSAFTQTEDLGTSDKHVITEVHMADLDYLAEEFIKLKMAKEELREQKAKMKSSCCNLKKECDCLQRTQQAELCLLALQYSMCRQHCWRLYHTSAEGGQLTQMPKNPPENIASVLQKLESDYNQMKDKISAGVPLQQLKPLSVDSEKITTGASYIPAQIIGDMLGNIPSWTSQEPQQHNTSDEENGCPENKSRNGCQHSQRKEKQIKKENSKVSRAVTVVPQDRDAIHNARKQEEKETTAACKEVNTREAWYDAEEDLEPAGPAVAAETGEDPTVILKDKNNESASEEAKSTLLCVSNLPSNVTESDVMLWFEKYHASEVSISALKNDLRVAIVMISGPQSAEAAVRELNGCSMQGHTLHVEHINRAIGGSRSQASASISGPEPSQDTTKPQTSKPDSSNTKRTLITQPWLSSSIKSRKVVCISPTAKGTCVPQHYGTMGSFDTLMAELTQRHPDIGRQRIVDALIELKAKHKGVLSGLPLRTISEMTSKLLTRPSSATQL
ncbi:RNA-binding protein 44 isoform X3 [Siniperca chuatsi]|uniref:RNA-binding protein 44 isoform X3 n=1 Tax=Siniperca chuatsi TaxID=119488 RepID=UPI001CE20B32|nr:RNA-binding protein 44 isoform X3 [Siniperca chuatsi]